MTAGQVRVAVVGTGDIGRGWAAVCAAAGWPVTLFDNDARAQSAAVEEISERARAVAMLGQADASLCEEGLAALRTSRSLLQACGEADWIIEAIHEDLMAKQKLLEALESVAPRARAITSSSSGFAAGNLAARCRRPDRVLVAHPLNPPELIPLIELIPGSRADPVVQELVKGWLRALGKIPVTVRKSVPGNVANRIAAAVWREAIALVLDGVIDVDDLDRAVSLGPGLTWAAAGPHLSYQLDAGSRDLGGFVQQLLHNFESVWADLASWNQLDSGQQHRLIHAIDTAYEGHVDVIRKARDRRLAAILRALESVKKAPAPPQ